MSRHLGDLLAALMQLSHKEAVVKRSGQVSSSQSQQSLMSDDKSNSCLNLADGTSQCAKSVDKSDGISYYNELEKVITRGYAPMIVKELLLLQSAGGPKVCFTVNLILAVLCYRETMIIHVLAVFIHLFQFSGD